jgi:hypothetical protein
MPITTLSSREFNQDTGRAKKHGVDKFEWQTNLLLNKKLASERMFGHVE